MILLLAGVAAAGPGLIERSLNRVSDHDPYPVSDQARALHATLLIGDLHADTLLWNRSMLERSSRGHVDLPRLQEGNVALQVFAAVTATPTTMNYTSNELTGDNISRLAVLHGWPKEARTSLRARALYQADKLAEAVAGADGQLVMLRTSADVAALQQARADGQAVTGTLLALEGAHALEGDLSALTDLYDAGYRMIGIAHFFDNQVGGSLHGVDKGGLTEFGRAVVQEVLQRHLIVDLAHASPAVVDDVLAMSSRPVVVSHTGMHGACDSPRNLDDARMQRIAEAGGLIGIGYWEGAVCDPSPAGVVRSIRYAIDLLGVEHVALGSDYDGATAVRFDTSELAVLVEEMQLQRFTEAEIRMVMGENLFAFLQANLP